MRRSCIVSTPLRTNLFETLHVHVRFHFVRRPAPWPPSGGPIVQLNYGPLQTTVSERKKRAHRANAMLSLCGRIITTHYAPFRGT